MPPETKPVGPGGHRMDPSADELAGIVDLFDALTREELRQALAELAFKRDDAVEAIDERIDDAVEAYHLVAVNASAVDVVDSGANAGEEANEHADVLAVGPAAFPELPESAEDLPHIMSVPERRVDDEALARTVEERFREEAAVAARTGENVERLLDLSYELDVWGDVDLSGARERLREAAE
jgi:vacuolar-type H+-ATPase subunit I/STV1